jgi:hypothetical protein
MGALKLISGSFKPNQLPQVRQQQLLTAYCRYGLNHKPYSKSNRLLKLFTKSPKYCYVQISTE